MKLYNAVLSCTVILIVVALILFAAGAYGTGDYSASYKYMGLTVIVLLIFRLMWKGDKD